MKLSLTDKRFTDDEYSVWRGWSGKLAGQLVTLSHDPVVMKFAPNDAAQRFANLQTALSWHDTKHPSVYFLLKREKLAGIVWFSYNERPELDCNYTFAVRLYESARGKGLAQPFVECAETDFRTQKRPSGIWLETSGDNIIAKKLYAKLGFEEISTKENRTTMRKVISDVIE